MHLCPGEAKSHRERAGVGVLAQWKNSLLTTKPKKFDILHVYLDSAVPV